MGVGTVRGKMDNMRSNVNSLVPKDMKGLEDTCTLVTDGRRL